VGWSPCDSNAAFVAGLQEAIAARGRVCLLFENAAELMLLPDLLTVLLSLPNLCRDKRVQTIFIAESPWADFHAVTRFAQLVCVRFAGYTQQQMVTVLKRDGPAKVSESADAQAFDLFVPLFIQFFWEICRDVHELRHLAKQIFAQWMQPIRDGLIPASDTRVLLKHAQPCLTAAIEKVYVRDAELRGTRGAPALKSGMQLPVCSKYLLLAAHLASRFPPGRDVALFATTKKAGRSRGRRASTAPLDEPISFTLERLLAIYASIGHQAPAVNSELLMQLGSLVQKKLLLRTSRIDLDCMRLRSNLSSDLVCAIAADVKFDVQSYFADGVF